MIKTKLLLLFLLSGGLSYAQTAANNVSVSASTQVQEKRTVKGKITSELDGTPIVGATVELKGTPQGVVSDADGNYAIEVNKKEDVLVFSFVGYQPREVLVENLAVIDIKMISDKGVLNEVVVVGSGRQKKISVTGAISSVKGSELKTSTSSLTNALAGRLSGLIANSSSGQPGSGSSFYIRGISTFGGRTEPLIMLDDVEISAGDLNNIPAETIESFSLLKDASATAIYGARGANGVMLITTKRGTENTKARINVTAENMLSTPMNFPKFVDGATWMELYNQAQSMRLSSMPPVYTPEMIEATRNKVNPYVFPDVDWSGLMFKDNAMSQRINANLSGGGSKVTYYMSLNANHAAGLINSPKVHSWDNNINNMIYNFQNNISYKVSPSTKIDLNMNAQITNNKGPNYSTTDLFNMALSIDPVSFPAYFPAQEGDTHIRYGNGQRVVTNPYAYMVSSFKQTDANTLNTSLRINQELDALTKGLSLNALVNFKNWSSTSYNRTINPYYYAVKEGSYNPADNTYELGLVNTNGTDYISQSDISRAGDRTIMMQYQLNYNRRFGLNNLGGMLMYMQRDYKSGVLPNRNQGVSGRFTYDYDYRYLAELNFGYNGTERLPKGSRFEFFPAISLGWNISEEEFFKPLAAKINNLKIRGSYGLVGSDQFNGNAPHFLYLEQVNLSGIGFTAGDDWFGRSGPSVSAYQVLGPRWERSKKMNLGLDLTLFDYWNITTDYFQESRSEILMQRASWPMQMGFGSYSPWNNIGEVDNKGFEFSSNYKKIFNENFTADIRANFTYAMNKYVNIDEPQYNYPWESRTGTPLGATWGYVSEGLFQSQEEIDSHAQQSLGSIPLPGDVKYRDLNGDNKIDAQDQTMISELGYNPRIQYGFGINLQYKKFDFGIFLNGSAMRKIMVGDIHPFMRDPIRTDRGIFQFIADDYWTPENPNAAYPRLGLLAEDVKNNHPASTYWLRNGDFLRLKTLELGYSFKYGRIFVNGDNVALFSSFKEWDPELNWNTYPLQRTVMVGVQLGL